ncbi:MAG: hypothetical protein F4W90_00345, partial [Gammaproteobacteria bacterium]|nr:hypothetical protein [Gammaproteobacteria bacterium]
MHKIRFATLFVWLLALVSANQNLLAQQTVTYSVSFSGNWTTASTPGGVVGSAHFTTIAGASHTSSASYWRAGSSATSGLESLAELGSTSGFLSEIRASNQYLETISASVSGGGTGTASFTVRVSKTHPLITLASMIGPSPDWFVGLSGTSLLGNDQNWRESVSINLYPYDAGTENGNTFSLNNTDTTPRGVIHSIRGRTPFSNVRMARITFTCNDCDTTPTLPPTLPPPVADPPTITAIERPSGAASVTNANSVSWIVSFSESVRNVSADDFTVFGTTASVTSISGSGSSYTATVSGGNLASLNASISLGLSSGQNIENSSGTKLSTTLPTTNQSYSIDNRGPRVISVTPRQATSSPFTLSISFNESLQAGALSGSGDVSSTAASISTPRGSGLTYSVVVTPRNSDTASSIPISVRAGAGLDFAGNASAGYQTTIDFRPGDTPVDPDPETDDPQDPEPEPDDPDESDPDEPDPEPDPPSPQNPEPSAAGIVRVNALSPNGIYHLGDRIEVAVQFDMPVSVTGSPTLELKFAEGSQLAAYERHMAPTILVFGYMVAAGDSTEDLAYIGTDSLALAGGSIIGENSAAANLKLPEPGEQGSLSATSAIVTTGRANAVPSFESETIEDRSFYMGVPIDPIVLPSATGGDFSLTYEISPALPEGLDLDTTKNHITGTSTVFMDATTFTWTATDADGDSARLMFRMTILEKRPLVFDGIADIDDRVFIQNDVIEPIALPSASGGVGELTYALTPALPAGLSVDIGAGQITGTPTVELARTEYTWRVVDEFDGDRAITFALTVLLDQQPMFAADAIVDDRIFKQDAMIEPISLPRASGGNGYLHYELSPDLPEGLYLDEAQLVISGSPTSAQMGTKYVWSVVDQDRDTASIEFSIEVVEVDELMFKIQLENSNFEYIQSSAINPIQLSMAQGGYGEYAYSLLPALPDGLTLDAAHKISGTPTQPMSATTYTWQATDFFGDTVAFEFTITIVMDEFPSFGENAIVPAMSFIEDSGIMTFSLPRAMGGNGELQHSLQPELPPGLSLDTDAFTIRGTPTAAFDRTEFTWQVTDIDGDMDTVQFMLSVDADLQPQFDASAVSFEKTFTQYSEIETLSLPGATGGNGELTFALTPPLVEGLTLAINERTI